jgi:hypothetical protein
MEGEIRDSVIVAPFCTTSHPNRMHREAPIERSRRQCDDEHEFVLVLPVQWLKVNPCREQGRTITLLHSSEAIRAVVRAKKQHMLRAVPIYDWELSIYAYIVYLSYNIRFFAYFSYSRILGNAGGSRSPR